MPYKEKYNKAYRLSFYEPYRCRAGRTSDRSFYRISRDYASFCRQTLTTSFLMLQNAFKSTQDIYVLVIKIIIPAIVQTKIYRRLELNVITQKIYRLQLTLVGGVPI